LIGMALAGAVALSACQAHDKLAAQDDQYCQGYGLHPGTKAYDQCRFVLAKQRGVIFKGFAQGGFDQSMTASCNIMTRVCQPDGVRGIPAP
jgi:hypothetical protein